MKKFILTFAVLGIQIAGIQAFADEVHTYIDVTVSCAATRSGAYPELRVPVPMTMAFCSSQNKSCAQTGHLGSMSLTRITPIDRVEYEGILKLFLTESNERDVYWVQKEDVFFGIFTNIGTITQSQYDQAMKNCSKSSKKLIRTMVKVRMPPVHMKTVKMVCRSNSINPFSKKRTYTIKAAYEAQFSAIGKNFSIPAYQDIKTTFNNLDDCERIRFSLERGL